MKRRKFRDGSWLRGMEAGFEIGWEDGYPLGRKEAVRRLVPSAEPVTGRPIKVLYVAQGTPGFIPIDLGIAHALRHAVEEVYVIQQSEGNAADAAARIRPDLVLVLNGIFSIPVEQVDRIREMGILTAVWIADDPYFVDELLHIAPHYDVVFTHESTCVPIYREAGHGRVHHLPLAAAPHVFQPVRVPRHPRYDVCFIGSGFPNRLRFLEEIVDGLADLNILIAGGGWDKMRGYSRLMRSIQLDGIHPEQAVNVYNASKIVINLHRSGVGEEHNRRDIPGDSPNPRTYEICAAGAFQLTDVRKDLPGMYDLEVDVATYGTPAELLTKIHHYLRDEPARLRISLNGLRKTLERHTYTNRIGQMLTLLYGST